MAAKKKLSNNAIASLVAANIQNDKPYDLNMAVNTLSLVSKLKAKLQEDFKAIEDIKEELAGVSKASKLVEYLDSIYNGLHNIDNQIGVLYDYLKPKD